MTWILVARAVWDVFVLVSGAMLVVLVVLEAPGLVRRLLQRKMDEDIQEIKELLRGKPMHMDDWTHAPGFSPQRFHRLCSDLGYCDSGDGKTFVKTSAPIPVGAVCN